MDELRKEYYEKISISQYRWDLSEIPASNHFGSCYKAVNKDLDLKYVVKILINNSNGDNQKLSQYFVNAKNVIDTMRNCNNSTLLTFKGLSFVDFDGKDNITIFLDYKNYIFFLQLEKEFSGYKKIDISQFKRIKLIGSGKFGIVSKVVNKDNDKEVYAAKTILLDEENILEENYIEDYILYSKREIDAMIKIRNQTILDFKGLSLIDYEGGTNLTVFTTFAELGSLRNFCLKARNQAKFDNTARQIILAGITYGMMILHQNNMIHRDFKPDNVLINKDMHPIIGDFGLSKDVNPMNSFIQSVFCGTKEYMAPEIFTSSNGLYDRKVDVYAFAISMFEIIFAQQAYPDIKKIQNNLKDLVPNGLRPTFPAAIKQSIKNLIEKCWSQNPTDRPAFEEIFYKLAFNIEDNESQNSYDEYYLDGVNIDRLFEYINSIIDDNIDLHKLYQKLKANIDQTKTLLQNSQSFSVSKKNMIINVIRNKEKLISKIEKMITIQNHLPMPKNPPSPNTPQQQQPKSPPVKTRKGDKERKKKPRNILYTKIQNNRIPLHPPNQEKKRERAKTPTRAKAQPNRQVNSPINEEKPKQKQISKPRSKTPEKKTLRLDPVVNDQCKPSPNVLQNHDPTRDKLMAMIEQQRRMMINPHQRQIKSPPKHDQGKDQAVQKKSPKQSK